MRESEIKKNLARLSQEHGLFKCVQCGKCSSACTMVDVFPDFKYSWAPRTIINDVLFARDLLGGSAIWNCLTCEVCELTCPSGVRFKDFITSFRSLAVETGFKNRSGRCRSCGRPLLPAHTLKHIKQKVEGYEENPALLCEKCKKRIMIGRFKENLRSDRKVVTTWPKSGQKRSKK
jgi:heterodisulfide reductase subunit C